ncbi:MAG: SDR family oxidoreductase [Polyangiaceae bacterium]
MPIQLKPINEQVVVITGASSGIGLATAYTFAKRGARVVLAARSEEVLARAVQEICSMGGIAAHVVADVSKVEDVKRIARAALDLYGRIDTWVNDAGVSIYGRLDEVSEADSRTLFDINFWGVVNGSLIALRNMRAGGAIINVGSEVSDAVVPLQGMYSASKHAVKGFTNALRIEVEELDKAPIAITLIQPTAVNTPYPEHAANYMNAEPKLPTPQIEPQEVADAIVKAAAHHTRDVKVGLGAIINTTVAKIAPSLGDKLSAKQAYRQQYDEPPRDPEGTLRKPGNSGRIHGSGGKEKTN